MHMSTAPHISRVTYWTLSL